MTTKTEPHYKEMGLTLTAHKRAEYGPEPEITESVTVLRCTICGALVEGNWENENYQHTEWHEKLGQ